MNLGYRPSEASNLCDERPLRLIVPSLVKGLKLRRLEFLVLGCIYSFYLIMFLRYRPYDIDNPWFLSFSYNACVEHVYRDEFMKVPFPLGMDGTQYFGRIPAFFQCTVLSRFGWRQWPAAVLSSSFIAVSLGLWCAKLRRLGYGPSFVVIFLVATGLSEPFVAAANRFRYECFSFSLLSAGLLLISYGEFFWGMLIGSLAIEAQPIALAGVVPLLILAATREKMNLNKLVRLICGTAVAALLYGVLHARLFQSSAEIKTLLHAGGGERGGFVAAYFEDRLRHIPELLVVLVGTVLYLRKKIYLQHPYAGASAFLIVVISCLMPHGNTAYMIFLYPFLVIVALESFGAIKSTQFTTLTLMLYFGSQYAVLGYLNRGQGYRERDIQEVSASIRAVSQKEHFDDTDLRIYGDYSLWFAHPHFYQGAFSTTLTKAQDADIYLCFNHSIQLPKLEPRFVLYCPGMEDRIMLRLVNTSVVRGNILNIYVKRR